MTKHIHCCSNPDCDSLWECSGTPFGCVVEWTCDNCKLQEEDNYHNTHPDQPLFNFDLPYPHTKLIRSTDDEGQ